MHVRNPTARWSRRDENEQHEEPQGQAEAPLLRATPASAAQIAQIKALASELGEKTFSLSKTAACYRVGSVDELNVQQAQIAISTGEARRPGIAA